MARMITEQEVRERVRERFWSKIKFDQSDKCWEWQGNKIKDGYGRIDIEAKKQLAHRYLFFVFNPSTDPSLNVLHTCDNPACVNPNHLFAGTQRQNVEDMIKKGRRKVGRQLPGEKHSLAKLTNDDVLSIRKRVAEGELQKTMAKLFNVSKSEISLIVLRKHWCHI